MKHSVLHCYVSSLHFSLIILLYSYCLILPLITCHILVIFMVVFASVFSGAPQFYFPSVGSLNFHFVLLFSTRIKARLLLTPVCLLLSPQLFHSFCFHTSFLNQSVYCIDVKSLILHFLKHFTHTVINFFHCKLLWLNVYNAIL